ncbi:hypothetical protein CspHIS471_0700590 [Cutaneotrichosporon sp. HIS471]|nr:hypothetical protein CspHIS471_0700590 [Cutaneotrichosporon sp. HIS471]
MSHQHPSPPLPNLHALSISPAPYSVQSDYPYNGAFGPSIATPPGVPTRGWTASPKRGRHGIPSAWFDLPIPDGRLYDTFRRDANSPPSLPPSANAVNTPGQPYYPSFSMDPFPSMGVAPSPPPNYFANAVPAPAYGAPYGAQQMAPAPRQQVWRNASIPTPDDDVIPTAIVIKNIPFAVSRETLLSIIESLGAPLPYAFNYHHDNGVFRGLAFANFRMPEEAASVVAALNGYDVQGRKLRVEYKKVLQPGEKDRIEREKAIKRMKSLQMDAVKQQHLAEVAPFPRQQQLQHQQQQNGHHPQISFDAVEDRSPPHSAASTNSDPTSMLMNLDLNDTETLRIYNMIYMFKEDRYRDELVFSRNLNAKERRTVHMIAAKLQLTSINKGDGDSKCVVVTKETPQRQEPRTTSFLAPYEGPTPGLRIKKSMPDLRGFNGPVVARDPSRSLTPQRSSGSLRAEAAGGIIAGREYASMGASHGRRLNGHGHGSGTFNTFFGTVIGAPPVPPLPEGLKRTNLDRSIDRSIDRERADLALDREGPGSSESGSSQSHNTVPLRNPRGPVGESRGFSSGMGTLRPGSSSLRGVPGAQALGRHREEDDEENARTREELDL